MLTSHTGRLTHTLWTTHTLIHSQTQTLTATLSHALAQTFSQILRHSSTHTRTFSPSSNLRVTFCLTHTHILTVGSYPHTLSHTFYLFYTYLHTLSDTFWSDFLWCPAGDGLVWNGLISVSASSCLKWVIFSSPPAHHKHKTITAHVREAALRDQTPEPSGTTEPPSRS